MRGLGIYLLRTSGDWKEIWEVTPEVPVFIERNTEFPSKANITVHVFVKPVVTVKLYNVAGPYLDVRPYLEFDGEVGGQYAWYYDVTGGITSTLGFDVSVMGAGIFDRNWNLVSVEKVFASNFEEHTTTFTLSGSVVKDGSGLSGVNVSIIGTDVDEVVTTDADGSYSLSGLLNGTYTITTSMSPRGRLPPFPLQQPVVLAKSSAIIDFTGTPLAMA